MSTRKRSSALGVSRSTLQRIMHLDMKLQPYKIQLVQELKPVDFEMRINFTVDMLDTYTTLITLSSPKKLIFTLTVSRTNRIVGIGLQRIPV